MIEVCNKNACTGCGLCAVICTKKAISLQKGDLGHLYPIIDQAKCVDCGLCEKKCPSNNVPSLEYPLRAYAAFSKDIEDYKSSTSGAAASVFSNYIIEQGGVVYGCAVCSIDSKTLDVKHIRVAAKEDLFRLKGSKYVQSRITDILPLLKKDIREGLKVLFIGTPCQVAAVRNLFPKNPANLYLVDIICHGVPSLDLLQKHIKDKIGNSDIDNIRFRDGSDYHLFLLLKENVLYSSNLFEERYKDEYYNAFIDGLTYRNSCHSCTFAGNNRVSDITIGDFWGLGKCEDASYIKEHKNGISVILPITNQGIELLHDVNSKFNVYERPIVEAINGNDQLRKPKSLNNRMRLFKALVNIISFKKAYRLIVFDKKVKLFLRRILTSIKNK